MVILAIYKGNDGSLGYVINKPYVLILKRSLIQRPDGSGRCRYESIVSFLSNWEMVQVIQEQSTTKLE